MIPGIRALPVCYGSPGSAPVLPSTDPALSRAGFFVAKMFARCRSLACSKLLFTHPAQLLTASFLSSLPIYHATLTPSSDAPRYPEIAREFQPSRALLPTDTTDNIARSPHGLQLPHTTARFYVNDSWNTRAPLDRLRSLHVDGTAQDLFFRASAGSSQHIRRHRRKGTRPFSILIQTAGARLTPCVSRKLLAGYVAWPV